MKILALILPIYILTLSTVPFCALDDCRDDVEIAEKNNQCRDHTCQDCPPFTQCCNHTGFTVETNVTTSHFPAAASVQHVAIDKTIFYAVYIARPWQPPRFG